MNRAYKSLWNEKTKTFVAVAENATSKGKAASSQVSAAVGLRKILGNIFLTVGLSSMALAVQAATGVGNGVAIGTSTHNCTSPANAGHNNAVAIGCGSESETKALKGSQFFDRQNPYNTTVPASNVNHYAVAAGTGAKASQGGVALGHNAENTNGFGIAIGANAQSNNVASIALGPTASATGNTALALGRQSAATGDFAQAIGNVSAATGKGSLAMGHSATATGNRSIAIGSADIDNAGNTGDQQGTVYQTQEQTLSTGKDSIALGAAAKATDDYTLAIGAHAEAIGANSTAFGHESKAIGANAFALGARAQAKGADAFALGADAVGQGDNSLAMGASSQALGKNALALGGLSQAAEENSIAVGVDAKANFTNSVALGSNSEVLHDNSVVIGTNSTTNAYDQTAFLYEEGVDGSVAAGAVSIGHGTGTGTENERRLQNVAAGSLGTDAVNVSQLKLFKDITDQAGNDIAEHLGGGSTFNPETGEVSSPTYNIGGAGYTDVESALKASRTEVVEGKNIAVTEAVGVDGQAIYTVLTKDDVEFDKVTAADAGGNGTVLDKDGMVVTEVDVNGDPLASTAVAAGRVAVSNGVNNLVLDAAAGTLTGLTNTQVGNNALVDFATVGRAATEEQLSAASGSVSTILGGGVINNNGEVKGSFTVNNTTYTTVAEAIGEQTLAAKTKVVEGKNITVTEAVGTDGQAIYTVLTKDDVEFDKVTTADAGGNGTVLDKDGMVVTEVDVNGDPLASTSVVAGRVAVSNGVNNLFLDASTGTLTGLTNITLDAPDFAKDGRAATEEQLQLIADAQQEIDDFAVKYDKNPDGTVNKDSVTFAGTEGTSATKDPLTGKTVMEGGTSLNNVGSAGDYTDLGNAYNAVNAGDLNNAVTDVTDKGLSFAGNAGDDVHRKLGETLGIKGGITDATRSTSGENVITRTDDKGNINIELATDATFDSITAADADGNSTVLDKEGVAVVDEEGNKAVYGATQTKLTSGDNVTTIDAGSVAVTNGTNTLELDATKGTLTGLTNTDLNGDRFAKDGRAATEEQLSAVSGSISTIIGGGVTNNNGEVTGPFTVNNNEYTTVASAIEKETKAAKTEVRKGTNIASVYESTGSNGQSIYTINADGTSVSAGSEAVTVTRGVKDSNNVTDYAVDLSDATKESLVKADSALQTVVTQIDGVDVKTIHKDDNTANFMSGENIVLTPETDGSIKVATAADVKFKSITTVEINASNVTTDSLTINNGPVINESGIDMRNKRVTNVAAGVEAADAVNLSQLEGVRNDLHTEIGGVRRDLHQVDRSLRAGVAAAMATAALPQAYLPGKSMLAMGGGTWKGESGVALGVSKITDNGKWVFKFSGNASTRGDYGGTVGAGYQW